MGKTFETETLPKTHVRVCFRFWICSFANAQWTVNLGSSLEMSPFERALASQTCKAVVSLFELNDDEHRF